jgi:hypothetical protein
MPAANTWSPYGLKSRQYPSLLVSDWLSKKNLSPACALKL